jgi:hypothetical protein
MRLGTWPKQIHLALSADPETNSTLFIMHIQTPEVKELAAKAFPEYSGKRFEVEPFKGEMQLYSCWNGGSRDYWSFVNLASNKVAPVPENGTPWSNGGKIFRCGRLPENIALVRWSRGRFESITIYLHPSNIRADMLPAPTELSWAEKVVLTATRSLKSSYAGIKNYRAVEAKQQTGITLPEWESAKAQLITRGMLNKAGAITDTGRNAIGFTQLYSLKRVV